MTSKIIYLTQEEIEKRNNKVFLGLLIVISLIVIFAWFVTLLSNKNEIYFYKVYCYNMTIEEYHTSITTIPGKGGEEVIIAEFPYTKIKEVEDCEKKYISNINSTTTKNITIDYLKEKCFCGYTDKTYSYFFINCSENLGYTNIYKCGDIFVEYN